MKRIRIIGLCLTTVFALSAMLVSSASAVQKNLLWQIEAGHTFPVNFLGNTPATVTLETLAKKTITCTKTSVTGAIGGMGAEVGTTLAHLFLVLIKFTGCKTTFFTGGPCKTKGAAGEEIVVEQLLGHVGLAHLGAATNIAAVLLDVPPPSFVIECTVLFVTKTIEVRGNVIGKITNAAEGIFVSKYNISFKQASAGMQELTEFLLPLFPPGTDPLMTNQHEEAKEEGGAFEESAQAGEIEIEKNAGEPKIRLVLD